MKSIGIICFIFIVLFIDPLVGQVQQNGRFVVPVDCINRHDIKCIHLTKIGDFGLERKARPGIPAHLHTGIDIKRISDNYANEPIYSIAEGMVISLRDDGPYAQIIIEHQISENKIIWSVYEHIAGIKVDLYEKVDKYKPIARFMNEMELNTYGWQFDHFHFEIMKREPKAVLPTKKNPFMYFTTYWSECYNSVDLDKYYYHPLDFLKACF